MLRAPDRTRVGRPVEAAGTGVAASQDRVIACGDSIPALFPRVIPRTPRCSIWLHRPAQPLCHQRLSQKVNGLLQRSFTLLDLDGSGHEMVMSGTRGEDGG